MLFKAQLSNNMSTFLILYTYTKVLDSQYKIQMDFDNIFAEKNFVNKISNSLKRAENTKVAIVGFHIITIFTGLIEYPNREC